MTEIGLLDYSDVEIRMYYDSDMERTLRLGACEKEPETLEWLLGMAPGCVLYDIGANTGPYSLVAATRGVSVVAFEPSPFSVVRLHENALLNNLPITVVPVAVHAASGVGPFTLSSREAGAALHQVGRTNGGGIVALIPIMRLDDAALIFELPKPDYLKIDVDGAEAGVLSGAPAVLMGIKGVLVETCDITAKAVNHVLKHAGLVRVAAHPHVRSGVTNEIWRRQAV